MPQVAVDEALWIAARRSRPDPPATRSLTRFIVFSRGPRDLHSIRVLCRICSIETRSRRFEWEATSASRAPSCAARSAASSTSSPASRRGLSAPRASTPRSPASFRRAAGGRPRGAGAGARRARRADRRRARAPCASRANWRPATASCCERMLASPAEHKWLRISRADVGEPGCGHWHSRPRLGPLGMLMGWWRVKVSSGCPLSGRLAAVER